METTITESCQLSCNKINANRLPSLLRTSVIISRAVVTCNPRYTTLDSKERLVQWAVVIKVSNYRQLSGYHRIPREFASAVVQHLKAPRLIQTTYEADVNPITAHQSILCLLT